MDRTKQPNFLLIVVDEMRYPTVYENNDLKTWSAENLTVLNWLRRHGYEFTRHYVGSTACCPSRATLLTGQYPSLHGVSQTDGLAKSAFDPDMFWLDPNTVPTLGNYFSTVGYQTYYQGKWHVSNADILIPGTKIAVTSLEPLTGQPDSYKTNLYLQAERLRDFGFQQWIGCEPHGGNPYNSGGSAPTGVGGRDIIFAEQIVELIENLDDKVKPWFLVASFVNPHDITLNGDYTNNSPFFNFDLDPTVPDIPPPPTATENLNSKPRAQRSYRDILPQALQPIVKTASSHRQLYYTLQKKVNDDIMKILLALEKSPMYDNTIIIFTSDHGSLLGAHGCHQKWHNMYEESLHVPLILHNPCLFPQYETTDKLTSHVDLLPTLLNMAHIKVKLVQEHLIETHCEVRPLVGQNLFSELSSPIYFLTQDQPTQGPNQINPFTGQPYSSVKQPNNVEAVIVYLNSLKNKNVYKYARYFDPNGNVPDEYEMYNVTRDPLETINLVSEKYMTPKIRKLQEYLSALLTEQSLRKRLTPTPNTFLIRA